jgi:predicted lipoprotein with Yx(FWY)xxD motif
MTRCHPFFLEIPMTRSRHCAAALALTLSAALATLAHADPAAKMADGKLVNSAGMTLYTFDRDVAASGKSACNGPCAAIWPPAMAAADAKADGDFTIVVRDDGSRQWAYKGKPVYTYANDKKAGDMAGDNFKDSWHVVK